VRIAYVTLHWPRSKASSIGRKILLQKREWEKFGHTVQYFSHMHAVADADALIPGQRFIYETDLPVIKREIDRIQAAKKLVNAVRSYSPDVIYLRWSMYVHPMQQMFSVAPVVIEVNTNDVQEHSLLNPPMNAYNRLTRSILFNNARGHVFTTRELAGNQVFTRYKKPFEVVANGIDLDATPFNPAPNNTPPRLLFIGTPGMPWHGIDKLVEFGAKNPGIQVDIAGMEKDEAGENIPNTVKFHGYLAGDAYEDILKNADAAIGTMALHRKNMDEAAPLKIRDCAARGIPSILPYNDTDLNDVECDAILKIPNHPENIQQNSQTIRDFNFAMRGKRIPRDVIRDSLDITAKEKSRVNFFQKMLEG
jgi:glycosyltransferase involved in cell wall biosynthesis